MTREIPLTQGKVAIVDSDDEGAAEIVEAWRLAQIHEACWPNCAACPHEECKAKRRQEEGS